MASILTDTSPAGMLHAIQADLRAAWASFGAGPGCELLQTPRIQRLFTGQDATIYNTVVFLQVAPEDAEAVIAETLAYFRAKDVPMAWWLGPWTRPVDFDERMRRFGPSKVSQTPAMAMDLAGLPGEARAPDFAVQEVSDDGMLRTYVEMDFRAFGFHPSLVDRMVEIDAAMGYGPGRPWRHFIALRDDVPSGGTSLFTGAGAAGIYGVATVPEARRGGVATAAVLHALHEAKRAGLRISTLQASDMGKGLYERLGFREYCRIDIYEWPRPIEG